MVEPARGTKASAHGPWGVYATAWELGWATNTPTQSCMALLTPYSTAQMRCQECRTVVCAQSSAARAAMGHWGQCPHIPGMAGHCLVTLLGGTHTHHHDHIYSVLPIHHIRRFELRFGCRTVVCTTSSAARAAMGHWAMPLKPKDGSPLLGHLGGHTHTPPQPRSALPTPYLTVRIAAWVLYGGVHIIFSR